MKNGLMIIVWVLMMFFAMAGVGRAGNEYPTDTFYGTGAGHSYTSGDQHNTFIGCDAGYYNNGTNNSYIGYWAGASASGSSNVFLGYFAGYTATGSNKLYIDNCYTGSYCTDPLIYGEFDNRKVKISGTLETTVGIKFPDGNTQTTALTGVSGSTITTLGNSVGTSGSEGTFLGAYAGHSNSGDHNTFVGGHSGEGNIGGAENSFFGFGSGNLNTSGNRNSFIGIYAGYGNRTGAHNVALGYEAGNANQNGNRNTSIGAQAGNNNTGSDNVFLGFQAGYSEIGSNKLYIDNCHAGGTAVCTSPLIYGEFDNRIVKIDGTLIMATVATPSDVRYKQDIQPLASSLEKILNLKGVSYLWNQDVAHGSGFGKGRQIGLIAQDVEAVIPELVFTDSSGHKALSYDKMAPVFVEAIKEQQRVINEQSELIKKLSERLAKLEQRQ
jgi:hypothetical protein